MSLTINLCEHPRNIGVCVTESGYHHFIDYRGKWRPIEALAQGKCKPRVFAGGIPHRYTSSLPRIKTLWAEPYPELPNLKRQGVVT